MQLTPCHSVKCMYISDFTSTPAFDPKINVLYVVNPTTSADGEYQHGLIALQIIEDCTVAVLFNTILAASAVYDPWPSPVAAGGVVYVAAGSFGQVFAVDGFTGDILWQSSDPIGHIIAPPIVVDGHLYVVDAGPNYNGDGGRLWSYYFQHLGSAPTVAPTSASTSFVIEVDSEFIDTQSLVTNGESSTTQKNFEFSYGNSTYYYRIPVAGLSTTDGLPTGLDWHYTDIWQDNPDLGFVMLGKYDGSTWRRISRMSLQVEYVNGTYCKSKRSRRGMTVTLTCTPKVPDKRSVTEPSFCHCKCSII